MKLLFLQLLSLALQSLGRAVKHNTSKLFYYLSTLEVQ